MKIGLSTYSLLDDINKGEMDVLDMIQWIADNGGEHMEIVPFGFSLVDNPRLAEQVYEKATKVGIELSNYAMPSNFVHEDEAAFEAEVERIKQHVDLIHHMGIQHMRHDVIDFTMDPEKSTISFFEHSLSQIVEGCRRIADYAAPLGITTTVENHSVCVQGSDRVQRVLQLVDRENFKTTLDVGNFLCVDEPPLIGVKKNLKYASLVHFKDFYYRPSHANLWEEGWFRTTNGHYLRGAILGHGDLEMQEIVKMVKASGYDGYLTLEFEGLEDCKFGSKLGMDNLRHFWDNA